MNVGTPEKPERKHVRKFIREFLNDPLVIDLPWLVRKILVNLIIVPFRTFKSTRLYQMLWTQHGSPLLYNMQKLTNDVWNKVGNEFQVFYAMRYGHPSLERLLRKISETKQFDKLIIVPLFPQYASSTTGSVETLVDRWRKSVNYKGKINIIRQFYQSPGFIQSFIQRIKQYKWKEYDHIVFSFHGLPLRQINKFHPGHSSDDCSCHEKMPEYGQFCYKATCYHTARLLAKGLGLSTEEYTVAFQSRLTKNWLAPFTDRVITELAYKNIKKILVVAPSFVIDCLETNVEIGQEYKALFHEKGGEELVMVKSLNDAPFWTKGLVDIIFT